jgi:hypothetical protein
VPLEPRRCLGQSSIVIHLNDTLYCKLLIYIAVFQTHNLKVVGSNPTPATTLTC